MPRSRVAARLSRSRPLLVALFVACAGSGDEPARVVGAWRLGRPMSTGRAGHSMTVLPSGKVLVAGGDAVLGGEPLATAELYDPETGSWTSTGSMNVPRDNHAAVLLASGKVLVAGGCVEWTDDPVTTLFVCRTTATAELYDPDTGTWERTGDMAFDRMVPSAGAALLVDGRVLVAGGWASTGKRALREAELYDPATGTWQRTADLPVAHGPAVVTLRSGRVLAVGGAQGTGFVPYRPASVAAELFDPASGTWQRTADLPEPAVMFAVALLPDGRVLVAGGCGTPVFPCLVYPSPVGRIYDEGSGAWSDTSPMTFTRSASSAVVLPSGKVLVSGGDWGAGAGSTPPAAPREFYRAPAGDVYDPASDTWTPTPLMPAYESGLGTAALLSTGEVLHAGGFNWFDYEGPVFSVGAAQLFDERAPPDLGWSNAQAPTARTR